MSKKQIFTVLSILVLTTLSIGGYYLYNQYVEADEVERVTVSNRSVIIEVTEKFDGSAIDDLGSLDEDANLSESQKVFENLSSDMNSNLDYITSTAKDKIEEGNNNDTKGLYNDYLTVLDTLAHIVSLFAEHSSEMSCYIQEAIKANATLEEANSAFESLGDATNDSQLIDSNTQIGDKFKEISEILEDQSNCFTKSSIVENLANSDLSPLSNNLSESFDQLALAFYDFAEGVRQNDLEKVEIANQSIENITSSDTQSVEEQYEFVLSVYNSRFEELSTEFAIEVNQLNEKIDEVTDKYIFLE
ncbi:MAG: hypothetical protein AAGF07_01990 [Patescibacteria group bacterium]